MFDKMGAGKGHNPLINKGKGWYDNYDSIFRKDKEPESDYTELEQKVHYEVWDNVYTVVHNMKKIEISEISKYKCDMFKELTKKYNIIIINRQKSNKCILCKYNNCYKCPLYLIDDNGCNEDSIYDKAIDGNIEAIKTIRDIFKH